MMLCTSDYVQEAAQSSLDGQESMCLCKKQEFEYILERSTGETSLVDSFGVKLKQFICDLMAIHDKDPTCKMLVFSQWHECLVNVAALLKEKDIKFVCLNTIPGVSSYSKSKADRIQVRPRPLM